MRTPCITTPVDTNSGSFDSVNASLREAFTALRMTGLLLGAQDDRFLLSAQSDRVFCHALREWQVFLVLCVYEPQNPPKRSFAEKLSSPLEPPFSLKLMIRMEI